MKTNQDPQPRNYAYYESLFRDIPKPFAFVDMDYLDENIKLSLQRAGTKKIRIASKSIRCTDILQVILQSSPLCQGLMAYSPDEAIFLSQKGFDDILIAYPVADIFYLEQIAQEVKAGKTLTLMIDCEVHLRLINQIGEKTDTPLPVCIDLDMSSDWLGGALHFGVWRSGVQKASQALALAKQIEQMPFVFLDGLMGYEAQIAGIGEKMPGAALRNALMAFLKKQSVKEVRKRRQETVAALIKEYPLRFVNAGGTGSLESSRTEDWVTELTVGSGFYSPALFDYYADFQYRPAAGFVLEVVRQPAPHIFTCAGGGYMASGAVGKDKRPVPYLPEGLQLIDNEGVGEVQTPFIYRGKEELGIGSPVLMRHAKAGELCERFLTLRRVRGGQIEGQSLTYRGESACFM